MGEHLRVPINGKIYIVDQDGQQIEFQLEDIQNIEITHENPEIAAVAMGNTFARIAEASRELSVSLRALSGTITFRDENDEEKPLPDDAWEKMILNGIHD